MDDTDRSCPVLHRPVDGVGADPEAELRDLAAHIEAVEEHLRASRLQRDQVVQRLRDGAGWSMSDIAMLAKVSDSYLTRRVLALGSTRRNARSRPRERRW